MVEQTVSVDRRFEAAVLAVLAYRAAPQDRSRRKLEAVAQSKLRLAAGFVRRSFGGLTLAEMERYTRLALRVTAEAGRREAAERELEQPVERASVTVEAGWLPRAG